jgi:hypothetical protein
VSLIKPVCAIVEPVREARVCFPVGYCGHAVLDCAWLTSHCELVLSLCVTSLQVREVIVVEEAGCQACEQLFPGERVCWEVLSSRECPAPATGSETS